MTSIAPRRDELTLPTGIRLHYQYHPGPQDAPCLVLLHSLGMDHSFWRLVAPALAAKQPVLCIDLRGHGKSDKPAGPYTVKEMADDAAQLAQALGHGRLVAAGASLGGCAALQLAIGHPERTAALGLIDTTAWYGDTARADWSSRAEKARAEGLASLVPFQQTRWFSDEFRQRHPDIVAECVDTFVRNDMQGYEATCLALGAFDARPALSSLRMPVSVIVGEQDYATPVAMATQLQQAIPGASLKVIAGARHLTPLEAPGDVIAMLEGLLQRAHATETQR